VCEIDLEIFSADKRDAALQGDQDEQKRGRRMRFDKGVSCGIQCGAHDFRRYLREAVTGSFSRTCTWRGGGKHKRKSPKRHDRKECSALQRCAYIANEACDLLLLHSVSDVDNVHYSRDQARVTI
jgi:hypothetical protein